MNMKTILGVLVALAVILPGPARADWDTGNPYKMHYPQLPNQTSLGLDVLDTDPVNLGDDFLCTKSGPISDIHIWASWLNDRLPLDATGKPSASAVSFKLSIWSDVPAGPTGNFSHPGQQLWQREYRPETFRVRRWSLGSEGFYDPRVDAIVGSDNTIWQYNFYVPWEQAYEQTAGKIYWLVVQAIVPGTTGVEFGWKTSGVQRFNDAAVWGPVGPTLPWLPLDYPPQHPMAGQRIDLAFVITGNLPGDVNGDGCVDVADLLYFVGAFGSMVGDPNWDPACDFNGDGSVDVADLLTLVGYFGECGP